MQATSLFLQPADPQADPPSLAAVRQVLRRRRVIGAPIGAGDVDDAGDSVHFAAGDGLLDQIGFTGCSVAVKFEPASSEDRDYCHLTLLGPYPTPRPFTGDNTMKPRCPECGTRLIDWQALIDSWQGQGSEPTWTCPSCATETRASRLRWRRHAAFGRLLVEIRHIFPAEATPHDALLEALREATGITWDYAWAGSSD